ncbi:hypothetical protein [Simiduia agarivorans]|uniref:Uncharacterized protein n=1 Tax=Simiduia agarivorans (strain DSM 21679 / JCM 13881 / BCRC 17597 / SA1) TaxID=1117647 RepID=K4KPE9_SIMAS|nr:hypothetical protein [Simiduia agarivorans]AFV00111.1 hypothetical protein M5M_14880 [Simiduia agarivorans SA1 = DSM 21679]
MTFLSVLLTALDGTEKVVVRAVGIMAIAAVLLVVATLGATLLVIGVQQLGLSFNFNGWPSSLLRTKWITEFSFFVGILSLFGGIGISGFCKNRTLGFVTSIPALFGLSLLLLIFIPTFN